MPESVAITQAAAHVVEALPSSTAPVADAPVSISANVELTAASASGATSSPAPALPSSANVDAGAAITQSSSANVDAVPAVAPAAPSASRVTVCRYVRAGKPCRFGADCRFSHDAVTKAASKAAKEKNPAEAKSEKSDKAEKTEAKEVKKETKKEVKKEAKKEEKKEAKEADADKKPLKPKAAKAPSKPRASAKAKPSAAPAANAAGAASATSTSTTGSSTTSTATVSSTTISSTSTSTTNSSTSKLDVNAPPFIPPTPNSAPDTPAATAQSVRPSRRAVTVDVPGLRGLSRAVVKGLSPDRLREIQEAELRQLKKIFSGSYAAHATPTPGELCFQVLFRPTDPDFAYELPLDGGIAVRVTLPRLYPNDPPTFSVPQGLPSDAADRVSEALNAAARLRRHQPMLRSMFIFLDRSLESLLTPTTSTESAAAAAPALVKVTLKARGPLPPRAVEASADDEARLVRIDAPAAPPTATYVPPSADELEPIINLVSRPVATADETTTEEADDDAAPLSAAMSAAASENSVRGGIEVRLSALDVSGVGFFTAATLGVSLVCGRCRHPNEARLPPLADVGRPCARCNNPLLARYRPSLAHESSDVVGHMDIHNATARDLLPSTVLELACGGCGRTQNVEGAVAGAADLERHCHRCHTRMRVFFGGVRFVIAAVSLSDASDFGDAARARAATKQKAVRDVGLVPGQPLPDDGTCAHYKKSRRWLRFGCCGRLFPCSVCHDAEMAAGKMTTEPGEKDENGRHVAARAGRMVCGLCSREQAIMGASDSPMYGVCTFCGADTVGKRHHTTFWEGGKGCRDVNRLNKNDARKGRGRAKIASKKDERVGLLGKIRVLQKSM